jgi:hypothetical protein
MAQLWELEGLSQNLDVCPDALAFVALPAVVLAFEPGIAGFLTLLHPAEEVLKGCV